jgi:hypothetical protein
MTIRFRGMDLVLRAETAKRAPTIAMSYTSPMTLAGHYEHLGQRERRYLVEA